MTASLNHGKRWIAAGVGLVVLTGVALIADHTPAMALVNESASLPRGVYVRLPGAAPARDGVVAIAQPDSVRAYLRQLGMPNDLLLIKRVAAVGGDTVCRRDDRLFTPGRTVVVQERDRRGVALPGWSGCRRLGTHELFLLGDTPSSFDSRYFGPVSRSRVTGVYREMLTW
ncbi:MAG: S26 family signal peptidase [Brevundimonas sp.]